MFDFTQLGPVFSVEPFFLVLPLGPLDLGLDGSGGTDTPEPFGWIGKTKSQRGTISTVITLDGGAPTILLICPRLYDFTIPSTLAGTDTRHPNGPNGTRRSTTRRKRSPDVSSFRFRRTSGSYETEHGETFEITLEQIVCPRTRGVVILRLSHPHIDLGPYT